MPSVSVSIPTLVRLCVLVTVVMVDVVALHASTTMRIVRANDIDWKMVGEELHLVTTGSDPYVIWQLDSNRLNSSHRVIAFDYFAVQQVDGFSVFLGPPISEQNHFDLPELVQAEGWQPYAADLVIASGKPLKPKTQLLRLDFGMRPAIRLRLRRIELREQTAEERKRAEQAESMRQEKIRQHQSISDYLVKDFDIKLDQVEVRSNTIVISGECDRTVRLVEYPPSMSIASNGAATSAVSEKRRNRVQFQVPRFVDGRDRLHSGWKFATAESASDEPVFVTARHYPTAVPRADPELPVPNRLYPKSQKGLGGIELNGPIQELVDLGVHAITVNLVLNRFVTTQGGPGRDRIDDGSGPAVFFNPAAFDHYDRIMEFAREHQLVVSAIVLIPRSKNPKTRSVLVHPEADGGIYAMPDLTSSASTSVYLEVLDRIASRYRDPSRSPGGITHWIAHNEIDFHTIWTNMGKQPRSIVTETYYRSMRMIGITAKRHNPHATVFASLTHHWTVPDDGSWQRLAPKELLTTLQRYSQIEGEVEWGVAYHPYPQSLFATVAWSDRNISEDFDTPLITIQNLEVLGRFLQQPKMLNPAGKTRTVLLSEQGFHTADYGEHAQQFQAQSLSYAMQRLKQMPWVESFHYHRWVDHPAEGGLKLGLRTLPTAEHPFGQRKQSWYVYQAIK